MEKSLFIFLLLYRKVKAIRINWFTVADIYMIKFKTVVFTVDRKYSSNAPQ